MKTILVQTRTSRGKEIRISTFENEMELNIFFKGEDRNVRKETIYLKRTDAGSLRVENSNGLLFQTEGNEASKLGVK